MEEPKTRQQQKMAEPCERRFCDQEVYGGALVEIQVGTAREQWCPTCVEEQFGIDIAELRKTTIRKYLTPEVIGAFCLGVVLMLILASMLMV